MACCRQALTVPPEVVNHRGAQPALGASNAWAESAVRLGSHIELIASENYTSPAVMEAQGSLLTNKYAEGYPGKRWYGGCECVDVAEQLAIDRLKASSARSTPTCRPLPAAGQHGGVLRSVLQPGDTILGMSLAHGGHLTHGMPTNFSGKLLQDRAYGVNEQTERIDYDEVASWPPSTSPS
jgi:glycine hydroxymethyltransferase